MRDKKGRNHVGKSRAWWVDKVLNILVGAAGIIVLSYLFFQSVKASVILSVLLYPYFKISKKIKISHAIKVFRDDFKEFLQIYEAELSAGVSPENAVSLSLGKLKDRCGVESPVFMDLLRVNKRIKVGMSLEEAFKRWSLERGEEHLKLFTETFVYGKRIGQNLSLLTTKVGGTIESDIEIEKESKSIMSEVRFEQYVMSLMPVFFLVYTRFATGDYLDVIYKSVGGYIFMAVCLLLYVLAVLWGIKVMKE